MIRSEKESRRSIAVGRASCGFRLRHGRVGRRSDDRPEARKPSRRGWRSRQRIGPGMPPLAPRVVMAAAMEPMPFWKCCWVSVAEALGKGGKVF